MKFFPAKTQRPKDMLGYSFASLRLCGEKLLTSNCGREMATRFVAIAIALSFIATLLPIANASLNKSSAMPCCVGKEAGHCDSGIAAKKPQPKEPMCGLHTDVAEDDGITIVAEPSHTEHHEVTNTSASSSSQPAAESASLSEPCQMDCGACTTSSARQQKRDRGIAQAETRYASTATVVSHPENLPEFLSSNDYRAQINPRGPPSSSIQ